MIHSMYIPSTVMPCRPALCTGLFRLEDYTINCRVDFAICLQANIVICLFPDVSTCARMANGSYYQVTGCQCPPLICKNGFKTWVKHLQKSTLISLFILLFICSVLKKAQKVTRCNHSNQNQQRLQGVPSHILHIAAQRFPLLDLISELGPKSQKNFMEDRTAAVYQR